MLRALGGAAGRRKGPASPGPACARTPPRCGRARGRCVAGSPSGGPGEEPSPLRSPSCLQRRGVGREIGAGGRRVRAPSAKSRHSMSTAGCDAASRREAGAHVSSAEARACTAASRNSACTPRRRSRACSVCRMGTNAVPAHVVTRSWLPSALGRSSSVPGRNGASACSARSRAGWLSSTKRHCGPAGEPRSSRASQTRTPGNRSCGGGPRGAGERRPMPRQWREAHRERGVVPGRGVRVRVTISVPAAEENVRKSPLALQRGVYPLRGPRKAGNGTGNAGQATRAQRSDAPRQFAQCAHTSQAWKAR